MLYRGILRLRRLASRSIVIPARYSANAKREVLGEVDAKAIADAREREKNELKAKQESAVQAIKDEAASTSRDKDVVEASRKTLLCATCRQAKPSQHFIKNQHDIVLRRQIA